MFSGLKLYALIAGAAGLITFGVWFADKIGDSRELDVRQAETERLAKQGEAENAGRLRARNCHALGLDRLWNPATGKCDVLPVRKTGTGTGGGEVAPTAR